MAEDDIFTTPVLTTVNVGVSVQEPEAALIPSQCGEYGAISIGPGHVPGWGAVMHIAVHAPDGQTLLATLGGFAFVAFYEAYIATIDVFQAGAPTQLETRQ